MRNTHDKDALQAALAYSRYLAKAADIHWMNARLAEVGLPPDPVPILLNSVGKSVYDSIRKEVVAKRPTGAGILLEKGERHAVVAVILDRMQGGKR
jgi:hypothetical protein